MIKMHEGVSLGFFPDIYSRKLKALRFKRKTKKLAPGYPRALSLFACKTALGTRAHIRL